MLETDTVEPRLALGDVIGAFRSLTTVAYIYGGHEGRPHTLRCLVLALRAMR